MRKRDARAYRELLEAIERDGWIVQWVAGEDEPYSPPFAYSVGMTPHDLPEVFVFGLKPEAMQFFINETCGRMLHEERRYSYGEVITELSEGGQPLMVLDVPDTSTLGTARWLYGDCRAIQLVYADHQGRFPWQPGHAFPLEEQPVMGTPPKPGPPVDG